MQEPKSAQIDGHYLNSASVMPIRDELAIVSAPDDIVSVLVYSLVYLFLSHLLQPY